MKNFAIILASGKGERFKSEIPKQFIKIDGKTVLEHCIEAFEKSPFIDRIIIVITPEYNHLANDIVKENNYKKVSKIVNGGNERKDSSYIGVNSIDDIDANVFIHDCARPFVSQDIIERCAKALKSYSAVAAAVDTPDTIIEVKNGFISAVPQRKNLKRVQTPQCFRLQLIKQAHELSKNDFYFTDDCGLVLKHQLADIFVVEGSEKNIKITYPEDI